MRLGWRETIGDADALPADTDLSGLPRRLRAIFEGRGYHTLRDCARINLCEFSVWHGVGDETIKLAMKRLR